jgi:hypothetical protein
VGRSRLTVTPLPSHVLRSHLTTMLDSVSNYLSERRKGFIRSAGVVGGLYVVGQYAAARAADMRDSVLEQRVAREKYVQVGSLSPSFLIVDTV